MTFVFYVRGQALSGFVPDVVVSDTINYQNAEVHFSEDWDGLDKWLHLKSPDGVEYEARLVGDRVEGLNLSAGRWEVWFHGSRPGEDGKDDFRITTDTTAFVVEQSGALDGEPLPPIELTAAEQIAAAVTRAETEVAELREDVEQYRQDVEETANETRLAKAAAEAAAVGAFGSQAAADQSAQAAHVSEQNAEKARQAIENMEVRAVTLDPGANTTVTKEALGDAIRLVFGIARGEVGPEGREGPEGKAGVSIDRIERTSGTGAPGETDTYTGYLSNGETFSFSVYNGKDGKDGKDGGGGEGGGAGDMTVEVYDPQGLARDVFAYAEAQVEEHAGDANNPHQVTAEQLGAVAKDGRVAMTGALSFRPAGITGYTQMYKNATSDSADYGTLVLDRDPTGKMIGLKLYSAAQKARIVDGTNEYDLYHAGNKPTPADIGAYGITTRGTIIPNNANLNDYTTPGVYYVNGSGSAATITNTPVTNAGYKLVVEAAYISAGVVQTAYSGGTAIAWHRMKNGDSWSAWEKHYTSGQKPTPAGIGAVAADGSVPMTGNLTISKASLPIVALENTTTGRTLRINAGNDNTAGIYNRKDANNSVGLFLRTEKQTANNAVAIQYIKDGASNYYNIYGEHNKPTASDIGAATTATYTATVSTGWTVSGNYYYKDVSVPGLLATDDPIADVVLGGDAAADELYKNAWALIDRIETADNWITVYSVGAAPAVAFTVRLKVVR